MSESDAIQPSQPVSLDEAIEHCIIALEGGDVASPQSLVDRFPEWANEVTEFLENWGGMERFASAMTDKTQVHAGSDLIESGVRRFGDYELLEKIGMGWHGGDLQGPANQP